MKHKNYTQDQVRITRLKKSNKKGSKVSLSNIAILLIFSFFIGLSLISNHLFLKEILIGSSIICMLLLFKKEQ